MLKEKFEGLRQAVLLALFIGRQVPGRIKNEFVKFRFIKRVRQEVSSGGSEILRSAERVPGGKIKTVFKVDINGKAKALSLMRVLGHGDDPKQYWRSIKEDRSWYRKHLGKYVNDEKIIVSPKDTRTAFCIQNWVNAKDGFSDIFHNIPNEYQKIIKKAEQDPVFKEHVKEFARDLLQVFKETESLPDIFAHLAGSPPNVIYSDEGKIVIVDLHLVVPINRVPDEYLDEFVKALKALELLSEL